MSSGCETFTPNDTLSISSLKINNAPEENLIPVVIYLGTLAVIGTVGNAGVIIVYGCKTRKTTIVTSILALASFDLFVCSVSIPLDTISDFTYVSLELIRNNITCKLHRFTIGAFIGASNFMLIVIATERYKAICTPFKARLTAKSVRVRACVCLLLAVFFLWPSLIWFEIQQKEFNITEHTQITVQQCVSKTDDVSKISLVVFNSLYILINAIMSVSIIVLYILIWKTLYRRRNFRPLYVSEYRARTARHTLGLYNIETDLLVHRKSSSFTSQTNNNRLSRESVGYTLVMCAISVIFILSFLPRACLVAWMRANGKQPADIQNVACHIAIRAYVINSAINPFIHCFMSTKFRSYLCGRCIRDKRKPAVLLYEMK